jgi:hypothetical protein
MDEIPQWKLKGWRSAEIRNAYERKQKKKLRDKMKNNAATWPHHILAMVKFRAKKNGVPFSITAEDIPIPALCPVFGVPFVFNTEAHPRSPSVDRIRPELGYVPGNVRVITRRANAIKSDSSSSAEILAVALYMEREGL